MQATTPRPAKQSQDKQLTLGGQALTLRFSLKATLALCDEWDVNQDALAERMAAFKMKDIHVIVWAGLRTHHPEYTVDQVLGLLDDEGMEGAANAVKVALSSSQAPERKQSPPKG